METVCSRCGVRATTTRIGNLVHLDALPASVDPEHEIWLVVGEHYEKVTAARSDLKTAAADMLAHHATFHPAADCSWTENLFRALKD